MNKIIDEIRNERMDDLNRPGMKDSILKVIKNDLVKSPDCVLWCNNSVSKIDVHPDYLWIQFPLKYKESVKTWLISEGFKVEDYYNNHGIYRGITVWI